MFIPTVAPIFSHGRENTNFPKYFFKTGKLRSRSSGRSVSARLELKALLSISMTYVDDRLSTSMGNGVGYVDGVGGSVTGDGFECVVREIVGSAGQLVTKGLVLEGTLVGALLSDFLCENNFGVRQPAPKLEK